MKPKATTFFLFCILVSQAYSQVWIDQGAVWHYSFSLISARGFYKTSYTGDTVINGQPCQMLETEKHNFLNSGPPNYTYSYAGYEALPKNFTYNNGDTVFWYVNNDFHVLYNFGAVPGDIWSLGVDTNQNACGPAIVTVTDTGSVTINSQQYRWVQLETSVLHSSLWFSGKAVERFGMYEFGPPQGFSINGLFPVMNFCDGTIADYYLQDFSCFEDNSFTLYNLSGHDECEYHLVRR